MKIIRKSNFNKWLAFSFPYISQLLYEFILWLYFTISGDNMPIHTSQQVLVLINSLGILFGLKLLSKYTHLDNCINYKPKNYTH